MVDIKNSFDEAFNFIMKEKAIVIPFLLSILTLIFILVSLFYVLGINTTLAHYQQIDEQIKQDYIAHLKEINKIGEKDKYNYEALYSSENYKLFFNNHPKSKELSQEYEKLSSTKNVITLIVGFLIWFLLSTYFNTVGMYMIAQKIKNKSITNSYFNSIKYYFSMLGLNLLYFAIVGAFILIVFLPFILIYFSPAMMILIIITIPLGIWFYVYINSKLIFASVSLFFDDKKNISGFSAMHNSFSITKNRLKSAFFVWLIIYGISIFSNNFGSGPIFSFFSEIINSNNILKIIILIILILLFVLAFAYLTYFLVLFRFFSYKNFLKVDKDLEI